jgi:hypothetical protein
VLPFIKNRARAHFLEFLTLSGGVYGKYIIIFPVLESIKKEFSSRPKILQRVENNMNPN